MSTDEKTNATTRAPGSPALVEPSAWRHLALTVNGDEVQTDVESRLLLSDFLRERLGLTGTHVGCEQGACGACTVLVDGRAVRSCLTLAAACAGRQVATVEGLADGESLHPIQTAFHDHHGLQCGFCTPGFLMSLAELHGQEAKVSEEDLMDQLCGNLCRCTGYRGIERAARQALDLPASSEASDE